MTNRMIRANLERTLEALDDLGEFGAACFVSMAIDALDGSAGAIDLDARSTGDPRPMGPSHATGSEA